MDIKCTLFFNIKDLIIFNNQIFHNNDILIRNNFSDYEYNYKVKNNSEDIFTYKNPRVINLTEHEAYTYRQKDNLIVYQCNSDDNWNTRIHRLASENNIESLSLRIDNETIYPSYYFLYYKNGEKRVIYSMKDMKWEFFNQGKQQPFENNDKYLERGPTKKFNYNKIKYFCSNLGFDIDDPDFFMPVGDVIYTTVQKRNPSEINSI